MDDMTPRLKAEFPLGDHLKVVVMQPLPAQAFVLSLSRRPADDDAESRVRLVRRLFSVMEALMGSDVWDDVVEHSMINGVIDERDLMRFVTDVVGFDWSAHAPKQDAPDALPTVPEPARAAPRIVSGA